MTDTIIDTKNIDRERSRRLTANGNIALILNNELLLNLNAVVDNTKLDAM